MEPISIEKPWLLQTCGGQGEDQKGILEDSLWPFYLLFCFQWTLNKMFIYGSSSESISYFWYSWCQPKTGKDQGKNLHLKLSEGLHD